MEEIPYDEILDLMDKEYNQIFVAEENKEKLYIYKDFPYKIDENDLAYKLFTKKGFEWGGEWEDEKDYQHFEMPDKIVEKLYPDE